MYKKILSYRPNFRPSLVFLLIPILISFIFIAKSFDQYSERENGESKNQELENNLITVKIFYLVNLIRALLNLNLMREMEIVFKEFFLIKKFHKQILTMS